MKKNQEFLKKIDKNLSKREYHKKYNYLEIEKISKIIEDLEKSKEEYLIKSRYNEIEEIKNFKIYQIEDLEILDLEKKYILIRNDEKYFFYNSFIEKEYREFRKDNEISLFDYIEKISNFISINNLKYIILDIEKDYIMKK